MGKRRIFVAIPISKKLQQEILTWRKSLTGTWPVRWIEPENLHITLVPPWYEEDPTAVTNLLSTDLAPQRSEERKVLLKAGSYRLQQIKSFSINFTAISFGPKRNSPRLIWATGETPPELIKLQDTIYQILNSVPESRPLTAHLTLARFKPEARHQFKNTHLPQKISWSLKVNSVCLMESHLKPSGAQYKKIKTFKLL